MAKKRIVVALGGNALQKKGEVTAEAQKNVAQQVGKVIAELADDYEIIVAHGNGPQVGNILIHEETAGTDAAPAMPLETAVAMSQGQIGYWLAQAIDNAFVEMDEGRFAEARAACVVTQVVVDREDTAFQNPTKPIGQFYDAKQAAELETTKGWVMREDAGRGFRRVVPSPKPKGIVEKAAIEALVKAGVIVIAAGGGGVPVVQDKNGDLQGVDAVIDKDLAAAELAKIVGAEVMVSVTAVSNAYLNFGTPEQEILNETTVEEVEQHAAAGHFGVGSMLPKIQAVADFAKSGVGRMGIITTPEELKAALRGEAGTRVRG